MTSNRLKQTLTLLLLTLFTIYQPVRAQNKYVVKVDKYLAKGDTIKAIKKLNKYIEKHPEEPDLFLKRAVLKINRGDLDPAMVDLNSYCSLKSNCGKAVFYKGLVRFRQHDYNGAIKFLSEYSKTNNDADTWLYLALSHMWLQNYPLAVNGFLKSLEENTQQPLACYNGGLAAYYMEDYELADSLFVEAISLQSNESDFLMARALSLLKLQKYDQCIELLNDIKDSDKNRPSALYNIGVAYYNLDQTDKACGFWNQSKDAGHLQAIESIEQYCDSK